ncbi:MAG TPA: hypothetical protein DIU00_12565 [Phycisphaerales bacterium]|nr:hypothetical protein [Phycisphaerales bacterium]
MNAYRNLSLQELAESQQLARERPYVGPRGISCIYQGNRIRAVGRNNFTRSVSETFDDFIIWHLRYVLGDRWFRNHRNLPSNEQHIVMQWGLAMGEQRERVFDAAPETGQVVSSHPTGEVQALLTLAYDIYCLCLINQLPEEILNRVRNYNEFQGVRYEIALAASLVRAGFNISWLESNERHAEFTATLAESGETIIVEAKSRHRPGVLHESGNCPDYSCLTADISSLYGRALRKPTDGLPYLIGIDVNLPLTPESEEGFDNWMRDVFELMDRHPEPTQERPAKEFFLVLTNFSWHYTGRGPATAHQANYTAPEWASAVPVDRRTIIALFQAFNCYGIRPEGVW